MNVKGGVAYINFNNNDISSSNTFVIKDIYEHFAKAYNSKN